LDNGSTTCPLLFKIMQQFLDPRPKGKVVITRSLSILLILTHMAVSLTLTTSIFYKILILFTPQNSNLLSEIGKHSVHFSTFFLTFRKRKTYILIGDKINKTMIVI
jgi:hypothetical protein